MFDLNVCQNLKNYLIDRFDICNQFIWKSCKHRTT